MLQKSGSRCVGSSESTVYSVLQVCSQSHRELILLNWLHRIGDFIGFGVILVCAWICRSRPGGTCKTSFGHRRHLAAGRRTLPEAPEEGSVDAWQQRERRNVLGTTWSPGRRPQIPEPIQHRSSLCGEQLGTHKQKWGSSSYPLVREVSRLTCILCKWGP